jgi:hypothetical protein
MRNREAKSAMYDVRVTLALAFVVVALIVGAWLAGPSSSPTPAKLPSDCTVEGIAKNQCYEKVPFPK